LTDNASHAWQLRVVIAGGGVAALETALALQHLAADQTDVTAIAPNSEFVYRPMTVREPFAYPKARRYPLSPIIQHAGARLITDELARVDPAKQVVYTKEEEEIEYGALMLALGARARPRYEHALTIDDRCLDETLHGLIQDIEGNYLHNLAFVIPARMAWPLPVYELALMTAGRAYDMNIELDVTIVTPEDTPLAIFGAAATNAVGELLGRMRVQTITSAYAEVPAPTQVVISPGDRRIEVERVIALPELYGPSVRGLPAGENGFIRVNRYGQVPGTGPIFAAGDATEFAVKHGGIAAQQADSAASSIAALAGAPVTPDPFQPVIRGMLLTDSKPLYLTSRITGGHGFSSEVTETPAWSPPAKIAAKYLAPYLDMQDQAADTDPTTSSVR
jgi:sulfide:quinone oxidoreductase